MKLHEFLFALSSLATYLLGHSNGYPIYDVPNKLFYIMLDGFRYDYLDMQPSKVLPGFTKFLREGVRADWMTPIFPSVSYPDWTTLVTGLWSESHGIVGNYMYDDTNGDIFHLGNRNTTGQDRWWTAEPIWTTATKQGLKSGILKYSRCDIPYNGILPDHCDSFQYTHQDREFFTNDTEKALTLLENGYDLVLLYTPYIDTVGHYVGPETAEMEEAVQFVDNIILYILTELEARNLDDKVNIIIVSDHGMKDIYPGMANHIELSNYINEDQIEAITDYGAFSNIKPQRGTTDQVYDDLKKIIGIDVYLKEEIPTRFHYKNNELIHDILIVAKNGYFIQGLRNTKQIPVNTNSSNSNLLAAHGFDPLEEKMRAIFYAKGPDFKEHKIIPAIQNVDVYPLMAHLLKLSPLPNNGTLVHTQDALSTYKQKLDVGILNFIDEFVNFFKNSRN